MKTTDFKILEVKWSGLNHFTLVWMLLFCSCATLKQNSGSGLASYQITVRLQADELSGISQITAMQPCFSAPVNFNHLVGASRLIEVPMTFNALSGEQLSQLKEKLLANHWLEIVSIRKIGGS